MPDNIYRLPPYTVQQVLRANELSETVDWGLAQFGVPDLWQQTEGKGVTVGVIDTGCDLDHPDLDGALESAKDFSRSRSGPRDMAGHGTHVAGVIAARRDGRGVVGVAPQCRLLIAKGLGDDGSGDSRGIAQAVDWCCEQGADVISMSLGSPQPDTFILAAIRRAVQAGKFVIAAAGNDGRPMSVNYPARYPETIAVAAVDRDGKVARFSSQGPQVDIAAPGQDILSTYLNGGYARLSGTSMATPFVSGVVSLVIARHCEAECVTTPVDNIDQLREHLKRTAKDVGPVGHDSAYGWGLIDPAAMMPTCQVPDVPEELVLHDAERNGVPGVVVWRPL